MKSNWAYGFSLNHEGAGVGTIYYASTYFKKEGIVNPASVEAYTTEEIDAIVAGAVPLMLDKDSGEMKDQTGNVVATAKV